MPHDPAVRFETLAVALGVSVLTLRRNLAAGKLPAPDLSIPALPVHIRAWRLSTLRKWNPAVAQRCAALLAALDAEKAA